MSITDVARTVANKCFGNNWRFWLANRYVNVGSVMYPERCDHKTDTICTKCTKCTKCGINWIPVDQPYSIHGHLGDFDHNPAVYIAECITDMWYDKNRVPYLIDYRSFQQHDVHKMSESDAIMSLNQLRQTYPEIDAWISLSHLHTAINMRWLNMTRVITELIERRQQWFTPCGQLSALADVDTYLINGQFIYGHCIRFDVPWGAEQGPYCLPRYLSQTENGHSTINIDLSIIDWLQHYVGDDKGKQLLIDTLSRALASSHIQWGVEECESFHRDEQREIIGIIAHGEQDQNTSSDCQSQRYKKLTWHTKDTTKQCRKCSQYIKTHAHLTFINNPYKTVLYNAKIIRQRKLKGVFSCAVKMVCILYRNRSLVPGSGRCYLNALTHFTTSARQLS